MTRADAIRRLIKLYGPKQVYYRVSARISSPERRQEAKAESDRLKAELEAVKTQIREWLAAQTEYQALIAKQRTLMKAHDDVRWRTHEYKFTVGINRGWCAEQTGQGDTWEEAIAEAERRKGAA